MVLPPSNQEETLVYNHRLSSVGPGQVTGHVTHDPSNVDLVMKLHYLRLIYYFPSQAVDKLTIKDYKEPMFPLLDTFYVTCGRFRRAESGRPYIKCNDCGVRIIEAKCGKTLDEWLEIKDDNMENNMLVYGPGIGPEMLFSPLVLIQLTTFKSGGISLGLSWSHVLGDAFVAAEVMVALGETMGGRKLTHLHTHIQTHTKPKLSSNPPKDPLSLKRVDPVGDHWKITNSCKMEIFSFRLSAQQIIHLQSNKFSQKLPEFEIICALIWKCIAKIRLEPEPKVVTICKNGNVGEKHNFLGNDQVISVVEAEFPVLESSLDEIGEWLGNRTVDDLTNIEEAVEKDQGLSDFIFYGANLTFLDLERVNIYGFKIKGTKPIYASCTVDGVGEEGVVSVVPDGNGGKVVTLIVPGNEVSDLKSELGREFEIA